MNVIISAAVFLTLAYSVVDDVDFSSITDSISHNRKDSRRKINIIDTTIKQEFDKGVNLSKKSSQKKIFELLEKKMILTPTEPLQEIDWKKIRKTAVLMMEEEFHGYDEVKIKRELLRKAEAKYKHLKEGDTVTIFYRNNGKLTSITGELHHVELYNNVSVNNTTISFIDMDDVQQQLFSPKSVETLRDRFVNSNFKSLEKQHIIAKTDYLRRQYAKLLEIAFRKNEKNGYLYNEAENKWWSARFTIRQSLDAYSAKQKILMKKRIESALTDLGIDE